MAGRTPLIRDRRQEPGERPGPAYTARAYRVADPAIASAAPGTPIPFILSTPGVKRDGLNLATLPFLLDNYRRNPVVLPFHSFLDFSIGRGEIEAIETPAGQVLYALASFDIKDPLGEIADRKYREGFLFAVSLGWDDVDDRGVPVRVSKRRAVGRDVLEFSVVSVPADTSALIDEGDVGSGARGLSAASSRGSSDQGLDLMRSRAFLSEARRVLVASDPRADALDEMLGRLAACSGPECDLLLADARQQLAGSSQRTQFAGAAHERDAVPSADETSGAAASDEALSPDSDAPADEASAEARRRAAMSAMVAAVWVENADEADDRARKRAREALLPEYRRLGLVPPAHLDAVIVAGLSPERRAALFVNGELEETEMAVQTAAGTRVGKKYSGSTRTHLQDAHDQVDGARKLLKAMLDEAEDTSGERGARGCGCGAGQSSHQSAQAADAAEGGDVPLEEALRALSLLYPEAEIRATVRKDGAPQGTPRGSARQVAQINLTEVGEEGSDYQWGGGSAVLPELVHSYLKTKAIKKLEAGPDGSETSMWFSKGPQDDEWPITPGAILGVDVVGTIPEKVMNVLKALGTGVDPSILDIEGALATDPDWDGGSGAEAAADEGAADEAPAEEPAAEGDAEGGTQSIDDLLARFAAVTAAA